MRSVAVIEIDRQHRIASWPDSAERLLGWTSDDAIGRPVADMFAGAEGDLDPPGMVADGPCAFDASAWTSRGSWLPVTIVVSHLDELDQFLVTPRILPPDRLDAAHRLASIVESSDDAIVSKDLNGVVLTWNRAAERIFGYRAEEMIGSSIRRIIPEERQAEEDATLNAIRRGVKVDHFETVRIRKSGEQVPISLTVSPIFSDAGEIVGASKIARDVTALREAEGERVRLLEESIAITRTLNEVGSAVASDLDRSSMAQAVTDAASALTSAEYGAFVYVVPNGGGEIITRYAASRLLRDALAGHRPPDALRAFDPGIASAGVVRIADTADAGEPLPRHLYEDMPVSVRSYLAVPVKARTGELVGGLFFGHTEPDVFTPQHERLAVGIASWASVALENARLYESAQEASRLKDDFLASLSHELRTPLNAILGYARLARSGVIGPERLPKALETIDRNAAALAQIVEDVLDVSRIIAGKLRLNVQTVDVPAVVQMAIDAVAPAAEAKGVRLEVVLDPNASPISGDPDRLQQVLWNLLTNAVKFTLRGGKVQVRLERVNSHLEITVSDTGIGIAPEVLPHIFERFRQGDTGTTRERGGLGLGLAIARQLVEMHGGTILAESAGRDAGSTFRIQLPLMIIHRSRDMTSPRTHPRSSHAAPATAPPDLTGVHVLVVDDEKDALALVADVLQSAGARVTSAHSAADALKAIEAGTPDVLVADLGMPVMDGFGLIEAIRQHRDARVQAIPAAALTAFARSDDRVRALRAGFHIHLAKPIEPAELMTTVAILVARRNPRQ